MPARVFWRSSSTGTITVESPDYWAVTLSMRYLFQPA